MALSFDMGRFSLPFVSSFVCSISFYQSDAFTVQKLLSTNHPSSIAHRDATRRSPLQTTDGSEWDVDDDSDRSTMEAVATGESSPRSPPPPPPLPLEVDVVIVGAGLGGLCAGAILNTLYGKQVAVLESHYIAGGCAHAFERTAPNNGGTYKLDSGPTILLGCSSQPYNALRQVLDAVGQTIDWIPYSKWGMIERINRRSNVSSTSSTGSQPENDEDDALLRWTVELGPKAFEQGPLLTFGGPLAVTEFQALQQATKPLLAGASIPALAMRSGATAVVPLVLRHFSTLVTLIQQGETLTGTFDPFLNGPLYTVTSPWLRNWLDALAFSLSGLPASRTAAAAMAFVVNDMHRPGAALDYPRGGMGTIVDALVRGVEQGKRGSKVHLRHHVESIDCDETAQRIVGVTLRNGTHIRARDGVICNAPVWSLRNLIKDERVKAILNGGRPVVDAKAKPPLASWTTTNEGSSIRLTRTQELPPSSKSSTGSTSASTSTSLLEQCDAAEMTGSFMHLHLVVNATDLKLDDMEAHYTVMDRSLSGDGSVVNAIRDGPYSMFNMIAVSNPSVLDYNETEGVLLIHAYSAGNEPYELWESFAGEKSRTSAASYQAMKEERAMPLWRAVESIIPDVRQRTILSLIGSPLTHERFLRRPRGTYGSATEDYLKDGSTPFSSLVLASDGVFPGIGVPSVAIAGASAANSLVNVWQHWSILNKLERDGSLTAEA